MLPSYLNLFHLFYFRPKHGQAEEKAQNGDMKKEINHQCCQRMSQYHYHGWLFFGYTAINVTNKARIRHKTLALNQTKTY